MRIDDSLISAAVASSKFRHNAQSADPASKSLGVQPARPQSAGEVTSLQPTQALPGGSPPQDSPPLTVAGLQAAWGQANSPYDLNGDGTVDVDDLVQFLAQGSGNPAEVPPTSPPQEPGPTEPAAPQELTLAGLQNAWGTSDPAYDMNGDGNVDVDDLVLFLAHSGSAANPPSNQPQREVDPARKIDIQAAHAEKRRWMASEQANSLAMKLVDRLEEAGFKHQPPTNIHEIVKKLDLSEADHRRMWQHIHARYPRGLGLNAVG